MSNLVQFCPRSYSANPVRFRTDLDFIFDMSGTLDGCIDFCIITGDGSHLTYPLTRDDVCRVIAGLHAVIDDIQANCLFDRDSLLDTGTYET